MAGATQHQRQRTKRCHWVPQSYLRTFAADASECRRIWRFSKEHGATGPELKLIEKVAVKLHLYAPVDPSTGYRDDASERKLGHLERWFSDPVWTALCNDIVDLNRESVRKMVSLLVAVMQFRNPANFALQKSMHERLREQLMQEDELPVSFKYKGKVYELDHDSWPVYRDATEEDLKRNWIESISKIGWYAQSLMKMRWAVVCADQPTFITSDNPVTIVHHSLRFRGIRDPETTILFPLSPTRVLNMDNRHSEPANQYYSLKDDGSASNFLLWRGANEYMFSSRHPSEVCAAIVADAEQRGFA